MIKTIDGGLQVDIQVDDWVDTQPGSMDADPNWGRSFKVSEVPEGQSYIMVLAIVPGTEEYAPTGLSLDNVVENFRQVPFESQ